MVSQKDVSFYVINLVHISRNLHKPFLVIVIMNTLATKLWDYSCSFSKSCDQKNSDVGQLSISGFGIWLPNADNRLKFDV